ncbi:MAG TPA: cell division topological specificity factor MinE [Candidatus Cybelea sp.]|nr:cell division topological specificity factor MinE [Candidatus Cybelea sp.]
MIDFLKRLFGAQGSSTTAKERLRLVLMTDHLELAPEMIDAMKRDLVDVISRYVEVDREKIDVTFEQQDRALAMLANIPILSVNRPKPNGSAIAAAPNVASPGAIAPPDGIVTRRRRRRKKKLAQAAIGQPAEMTPRGGYTSTG